jgi:RNA polymerase sigma-70 factor (ECF subfamily)
MPDLLPDDSSLMKRLVAQDQTALSELYEQYGRLVYSFTLRVLQNNTLAEEATQDTFLKVWNHPQSWNPELGRLVSWLLTIARYTAIDRLRRERRVVPAPTFSLDDMIFDIGERDDDEEPDWMDGERLRSLLERLPAEQREVLELAYFQGMTHTELAEALQLPLGTVKTRLRIGLQRLKGLWRMSAEPTEDRSG